MCPGKWRARFREQVALAFGPLRKLARASRMDRARRNIQHPRAWSTAATRAAGDIRGVNRPAIRKSCDDAVNHGWLVQRSVARFSHQRRRGSTKPRFLLSSCSKMRASRLRSIGSSSLRIEWIHVHRQSALAPEIVERVFIGGHEERRVHFQPARQGFHKTTGIFGITSAAGILHREKRLIFPDRNAVLAPIAAQRPAGQRFAGIPLALSEMQQRAGREAIAEPQEKLHRQLALVRSEGAGGPLGSVRVLERDEGRLAAHGEPNVARFQLGIHADRPSASTSFHCSSL